LLETASELGVSGLILVPEFGREKFMKLYPDHSDFDARRDIFMERLAPLAARAEQLGVTILLEPLNRYEAYFLLTVGQGAEICRQMRSPAVRVMADLFHMNIEEADPVAAIRENADYIAHVHLVDSNRRLPGLGSTDFGPIISTLDSAGFGGWLCMECGITGDPAAEVPASVDMIRKLM